MCRVEEKIPGASLKILLIPVSKISKGCAGRQMSWVRYLNFLESKVVKKVKIRKAPGTSLIF